MIFDCDGTLVDSERLSYEIITELVKECGFNISIEQVIPLFKGAKIADSVIKLEEQYRIKLPNSFISDFRSKSISAFNKNLKPMPHVPEMLSKIDLPKCVASSAPKEKVDLCLRITGLIDHFDHVYSSYEINSWKPAPDLFITACHDMNYIPSECIVIEDSNDGIQAGLNANMKVIAYNNPDFIHRNVIHIDDHRELIDIIKHL